MGGICNGEERLKTVDNTILSPGYFIRLALAEARLALDEGEVPVGAVVVRNGLLIGRGHNRTKSLADPTAHAELLAITAACSAFEDGRLDDCDIYSTLEPCPMCAGAIVLARVKRLYYAAPDIRMGACGTLFDIVREPRLNHRIEVYTIQDFASESAALLEKFFKSKR